MWKYIQNTVNPKPEELESWILRECSSHTMCHVSPVTCHLSKYFIFLFYEKKNLSFRKNWTKWWSLSLEGMLSTGPTPSSFNGGSLKHVNKPHQTWNVQKPTTTCWVIWCNWDFGFPLRQLYLTIIRTGHWKNSQMYTAHTW